jgi:hypothetical protein
VTIPSLDRVPWSSIQNTTDEKYLDGFEAIGDVGRRRNKNKEICPSIFESKTKEDPIGNSLLISQSIRTSRSDAVIGVAPVYESYSTNRKLKNYSQGLIVSAAVDHVVPWNHSESARGLEFKSLRPDYGKMYPKSSQEMVKNAQKGDILPSNKIIEPNFPEENDVFEYK